MKKVFLILIGIFQFILLFAQDIILNRNGDEIKVKIIETGQKEVKYKKFDNLDGPIYYISKAEIFMIKYENGMKYVFPEEQNTNNLYHSIESEKINVNEYGGNSSYGIAIGGGGFGVGVPLRIYPGHKFALEAGAYLRPVLVMVDDLDTYLGLSLAGGPTLYFSKIYKQGKNKIVLNGISLKGGYCFSTIGNGFFSLNWAHEAFKKENKKRSFNFELGFGLVFWSQSDFNDKYPPYNTGGWYPRTVTYDFPTTSAMIYWKCHWNWYK